MKNYFLNVFFAFSSTLLLAQVGVGTTTPSAASMLEISSTSDGGITYKGLMPPRVPDVTARDAIAATSTDIGLTVFVDNIDCLQIWNGTSWENIHCNNNVAFIGVVQNFDLGTSWGYTTDVPFFDNGVLGFNGTDDFATITFNTIDVSSSLGGVTVAFDYDFFEFDNGDDAEYILIIDGISQTPVTLINGSGDLSLSGSISESIPGGTFSVALQVRIKQNGDDVGGFDNFRIF